MSPSIGLRKRNHRPQSTPPAKVIDACPDAQWRLIFAMARYGALRCPSEILEMKWSDVDWEKNEMFVRSRKTAHHVGGGSRRIPIFADLMPFIQDAFDVSEGKGEYLIHRYRDSEANLRTQLHRIIDKAGVQRWPKAFQNLRASRATDLVLHHPLHVVSNWTGHSVETMRKFYLQVTDEHREAALKVKPELLVRLGEAKPKAKPSMREGVGQGKSADAQSPAFSAIDNQRPSLSTAKVAAEGQEQPRQSLGFTDGWEKGEAKAEAVNVGQVVSIAKIANILEQILLPEQIEELVEILRRVEPTATIDE